MHFLVVTIIFIIKIGSCSYLERSNYFLALLLIASLHGSPFSLFQWNFAANLYTSRYSRITYILGNFFCFITKCYIGLDRICSTILPLLIDFPPELIIIIILIIITKYSLIYNLWEQIKYKLFYCEIFSLAYPINFLSLRESFKI